MSSFGSLGIPDIVSAVTALSRPRRSGDTGGRAEPRDPAHLDEGVDVQHERLGPADDELVDAGDGVGPDGGEESSTW